MKKQELKPKKVLGFMAERTLDKYSGGLSLCTMKFIFGEYAVYAYQYSDDKDFSVTVRSNQKSRFGYYTQTVFPLTHRVSKKSLGGILKFLSSVKN